MHTTRMYIRKDMAHTLVFASTLFIIAGLQASFQCHGVCHIYVMVCWSMHCWHSVCTYVGMVLQYIQYGIGLYTNVHLSLYNIYIIARSGMHNIWVWKSTVMYIHTYYIMYNMHAVLRFARIYLQLYNIFFIFEN